MTIVLPQLPYERDALEPVMSATTVSLHHGRHHKGYVETLLKLIENTRYADTSLLEIIHATAGDGDQRKIFNNAAQAWNHTFFWNSMTPNGGGKPGGVLADMIDRDFGSYDGFRAEFLDAATGQFGSGWAWLVVDGERLAVATTANADTPLTEGRRPVLTCDVWEHAYYLDYRNERRRFVAAFLDDLVNWAFAETMLSEQSDDGTPGKARNAA